MSTMSKKKSKPKQEPRTECETVVEVPARCPRCQSTTRTLSDNYQKRPLKGTLRNGMDYNQVKWLYVTCSCGQRYRVIRYEFV